MFFIVINFSRTFTTVVPPLIDKKYFETLYDVTNSLEKIKITQSLQITMKFVACFYVIHF